MAVQADKAAYFQVGHYVDAMDSSQKWLAAVVQQADPAKGVLIRFDGWSSKWNEWLSLRSTRLAPFRRYSQLYGGQQSAALRDWCFREEELQEYQVALDQALLGDYSGFATAYDISQFFRGRLFTLIDNLLSTSLPSPSAPVIHLLETALRFALQWVAELPTHYNGLYQALGNGDLYLSDKEVALAEIWPELFCSIERILGSDLRLLELMSGPVDEEINPELPESIRQLPLLSRFMTLFLRLGGFTSITTLLSNSQ